MFDKNDKKRLYWLIDHYLSGKINARFFCDEYYYCYDLELERKTLNEQESRVFHELGIVVNRFNEFEEDLKKYPGVYFSEKELKKKVLETQILLN